jgi:PPK2 family polyphosphate:nucleotide phosphotransferase
MRLISLVEPGAKVKLKDFDPGYHGKYHSRDEALPELQTHLQKMDHLQYLMYAERKHSLLIVLQGIDASGKDGTIRHIFTGMNPAGCRVVKFKVPTEEERAHDFLWRVHPHAPPKGAVEIFNRSHYEDVLVARVHDLVPEKVWSQRYELINDFEKLLVTENSTTILKFFLHISKEEQLERFERRLEDPNRQWKISEADYEERKYWDDYMKAYEDVFRETSTECAPWYVIPANHKWYRDLEISRIITERMEDLKMNFPKPLVDLDYIRRKYHEARKAA